MTKTEGVRLLGEELVGVGEGLMTMSGGMLSAAATTTKTTRIAANMVFLTWEAMFMMPLQG